MENAEEILQCLDEFSKLKPKDIPRELEEYLCFVAKTGDPVYQWPLIKCLFREKLISVITEFYEACPSVEIPPCPNVDAFNYDAMKSFILEKLDTFAAAPFTVQRICELLTSPRKEYNRIDKYMRALEKNILVVSTREPGNRKSAENGESVVNGLESEHVSPEIISSDINVEVEMDETAVWPKADVPVPYANDSGIVLDTPAPAVAPAEPAQDTYISAASKARESAPAAVAAATCSSSIETVITQRPMAYIGYTPNITDLIVDPSATSSSPDAEPSSEPAQKSGDEKPLAAVDSGAVFSMSTEPILAAEPPAAKEQPAATADCSANGYTEPEPSEVHVDQPPEAGAEETVPEATMASEPSDAAVAAQPSEPHATEGPTKAPAQSEPEPVVSSAAAVEAHPSDSEAEPAAGDTGEQAQSTAEAAHDTTISSTDEQSDVSSACADSEEAASCTPENQVSESNVASEYVVSQTDAKSAASPQHSELSPATSTDAAEVVPATSTGEESMDVDEAPLEPTPAPTESSPAPTEPSDAN